MNTNLQAVAVNVTLSKKITIHVCSIYLPPGDILSKNSLVNLIDQLPHPFMLVGDFNGHSEVWGCSDTNDRGEIMEDIIPENDLCLLNEKQPTYRHPPTGNYYAIDISLCHPNIYLDFDWSVCDDLHGSDHFPILIREIKLSDSLIKNKKSECIQINSSDGIKCYSAKQISNSLGKNFQKKSSSLNYSQQFQDIKFEKERENLNFQSQNNEKYSLPFKLTELKESL